MRVSIRDARESFSKLIEAAARGERIQITRRGRVVAELSAPATPDRVDKTTRAEARRGLRATLPSATESSANVIRQLREERG